MHDWRINGDSPDMITDPYSIAVSLGCSFLFSLSALEEILYVMI